MKPLFMFPEINILEVKENKGEEQKGSRKNIINSDANPASADDPTLNLGPPDTANGSGKQQQ